MATDTLIGFDSAWTDNAKAPGAICALVVDEGRPVGFHPPRLATFAEARSFIEAMRSPGRFTLLAIDQPTIVSNATGMRPVERVAASVVSWLGGGVQPSNRGRVGMFCDASPIWPVLRTLDAIEDQEAALAATTGMYVMEVFPALALPSLGSQFFGRLRAPRYNPARRRTFRLEDWRSVCSVTADQFMGFRCGDAAAWCAEAATPAKPAKGEQDRLDAMLCLLVALHWRLRPRDGSMMLGSLEHGYIIFPASADLRGRIEAAAALRGVPAL